MKGVVCTVAGPILPVVDARRQVQACLGATRFRAGTIPFAFALMLALAGCDRADMVAQDKAQTWDKSTVFADQSSMRPPVPGAVARDEPNQPVPQPATITAALIARGHERYDIFCSPCHGVTGDGLGMIVQRGFPRPPALALDRLKQAKASYIYDVITNGHGVMYSYADRVPPADRWAIIAYVRALQQSQGATVAGLPDEDKAKLESQP